MYSRLLLMSKYAYLQLEATIQAAQDAKLSANKERLKWKEKINELEMQKNDFRDKENRLVQKAKELQDLTQVLKKIEIKYN